MYNVAADRVCQKETVTQMGCGSWQPGCCLWSSSLGTGQSEEPSRSGDDFSIMVPSMAYITVPKSESIRTTLGIVYGVLVQDKKTKKKKKKKKKNHPPEPPMDVFKERIL